MNATYRQELFVRWSDLDANGHMANTSYLDVCVDVRMGFFESEGFPRSEFLARRIGPVVRRDEVDYYRELRLGERFNVDLRLAGSSDDCTRFRLCNRFFNEGGVVVTKVVSTGGWLGLDERRLVIPPDELQDVLRRLERTEDFEELSSSVRE